MVGLKNIQEVGQLEKAYEELIEKYEDLKRKSLKTENALEYAPTGYALIDSDGSILEINTTFTQVFGFSAEECQNRSIDELIVSNEYQHEAVHLIKEFENRQDISIEKTIMMHKDGTPVHVSIHAKPVFDQGKFAYSCFHFIDISKQLKAELHASVQHEISHAINSTRNLKELYRSIHLSLNKLIDTTNFFIALYNKKIDQLKFVYYTDVAEEKGSEIEIIDNASQLEGSYTARVIFDEKPVILYEEEIKRDYDSNNTPIGPISKNWLGVPLSIKDKVIGVVAVQSYSSPDLYTEKDIDILQSVTEQIAIAIETKRTEGDLKESEKLHKTLFDQGADAMMVHDLGGRFLKVNEVAIKRFGYSEEEFLNMTPADLAQPGRAEYVKNRVSKIINDGSFTSETIMMAKSGTEIPSELSSKMIDFKGRKAIISSSRDITERKKAEKEHEILEQRLSRAQTMQALGQLAGSVAHDLNNILSGISSYPELLLHKISEDDPLRGPLKIIMQSGFKAADIVEDMLALTRLGIKGDDVININRSLTDFLSTPEYDQIKSDYPDVHVKTSFEKNLLNINGSDVHLSKVFMNLLKNGFEAISAHGEIQIVTENRYVSSQVINYDFIKEGEYVTVMISDTGIGIPKEDIERIFEPFYTTKKMGKSGTGLGMAIIWRTIKDHNGYILVDSEKENGTTFTLFFPASRKELPDRKPGINLNDYMGNQELIYMVDDVYEQRLIAGSILEELGYRIKTFQSGEEALEYLEENKKFPDLYILDMIMEPGMNGAETYRRICHLNDSQKAIIASGFSETNHVKNAIEIGVGKYLKKPYTLENIAVAVKNELD